MFLFMPLTHRYIHFSVRVSLLCSYFCANKLNYKYLIENMEDDNIHRKLYCIVFDGEVIAAQCTATFFEIYSAPPNLGITRT